jgi:hypothetical protein
MIPRSLTAGVVLLVSASALADSSATTTASSKPADARPISEFKPSRDGWGFTNYFPGFPSKSTFLDRSSDAYGLCGGMSYAATDYFLAKAPMPVFKQVPQKNSPLWLYLFRRQMDSIDDGQAGKFIKWTQLEDTGRDSLGARTVEELKSVIKKLDAGEPAILGLILTDDPFNVFSNHQIVALRYKTAGDVITLHTYDPNYPGDDSRIIKAESYSAEVNGEKITQVKVSRGSATAALRPFRGFFVMKYKFVDPVQAMAGETRKSPK